MAREILDPRWGNNSKTLILCKFRFDDGQEQKAAISVPEGGTNPDWDEVIEKFGVEYLDKIAADALAEHNRKKQQQEEQIRFNIERQQKEILFNVKAEAFDLDVVKDSKNRELKNKIRRANSITEVYVYTALLHMLEDPIITGISATTE